MASVLDRKVILIAFLIMGILIAAHLGLRIAEPNPWIVKLFTKYNAWFEFNDTKCLSSKESPDMFKVPNIVHYNWYTKERTALKFKHWISVLSAHKIIKPERILLHYNLEPTGKYWDKIKRLSSVTSIVEDIPDSIAGKKLDKSIHFTAPSNIGRINAMLETGGIYLDFDVLAVKSFDELRKYPCTLGYETHDRLCGGIIICSKDSTFMYLWANTYLDDYKPNIWAYNSGKKPSIFARRFPHLIHLEKDSLNRPNYFPNELVKIWGSKTFNWRENYAVHTWYRLGQNLRKDMFNGSDEPSDENIWTMNNTYAEISRYILNLPDRH